MFECKLQNKSDWSGHIVNVLELTIISFAYTAHYTQEHVDLAFLIEDCVAHTLQKYTLFEVKPIVLLLLLPGSVILKRSLQSDFQRF